MLYIISINLENKILQISVPGQTLCFILKSKL